MTHAVFIGSSNVSTRTGSWPELLSARRGWICHNAAIAGGAFTGLVDRQFITQINAAIADTSYDHDLVEFLFIADTGNDIRGTASITADAPAVFAAARDGFPNARIIIVPVLWGIAADNLISGRQMSLMKRVQELNETSLPFGFEIIDYSWTWHYDTTAWMLPNEVHYTVAGYKRIADFVDGYLNGRATDSRIGTTALTPTGQQTSASMQTFAKREGNTVHVRGTFSTPYAIGVDTPIAYLPTGCEPITEVRLPIVSNNRSTYTLSFFPRSGGGVVRSLTSLPSDYFSVNGSFQVF